MMRVLTLLCVLAAACGDDGESTATDGGEPGVDAAARIDTGVERDTGVAVDGPPGVDAGSTTEPGWRAEPALPVRVQEISAAVIDDRIWIAGGFEGTTSTVTSVRVFDPATGGWSDGPPLPSPRHHLMLVALDGDLYAIGGMSDLSFEPLETAWVLRGATGDWTPIAPLPEPRAAGVAGAIDGVIYVAAGQTRGGVLADDTLVYDPVANDWSTAAPITTEREHLAGFVHDGELWAVGGRRISLSTNTDVVEIYDPVGDAWRAGPSLVMARGGFGAAVLDGVAYAIGGEQPDRALSEAESLALPGGAWTAIDPVPTPRHGHAVVAAAGRVYVIGGADEPIFAAVDAVESYAP